MFSELGIDIANFTFELAFNAFWKTALHNFVGDSLGPKLSGRYREVVELWWWSVREALLYI